MKELEAEVMVVGNNLRSLEISEGKASEREDTYQTKLNELSEKFQEVCVCPYHLSFINKT